MPEMIRYLRQGIDYWRSCKPDGGVSRAATPIGHTPGAGPSADRIGHRAEGLCRLALRLAGYRVVAVRARTSLGEIDIVARRGGILAIIEVKARGTAAAAAGALSPRQCRRLTRAAAAFLGQHPHLAGLSVRFDLMLVTPWRWPRHLPDAWRP